jgi:alkylhydroperoxidase/carboxymuconolactone decarboxylase family protein YurZ
VPAYQFLDEHWQGYFPALPARAAYLDGIDALVAGIDGVTPAMVHLALAAAHTARRSAWGVATGIEACYAAGVDEAKIAEAISLALWPCGINCFLDASQVWLTLIRSGRVQPSPPFRAWADTPGQEGFRLAPRGSTSM